MIRLACTGHRPNKLGGYGVDVYTKLVTLAHAHLLIHRPDVVITGMALGWDQAVAVASRDIGVPYIAAIPFVGQEESWPSSSVTVYNDLLRNASDVHICTTSRRKSSYNTRNIWMVDNSDVILALWDGSSSGTGHCVMYANRIGIPIHNLWGELAASPC